MGSQAELLNQQFEMAKMVFDMTVGDLDRDLATRTVAGATIGAILPIYAHVLAGLDVLFRKTALGEEPLAVAPEWQQLTGMPSVSVMQVPGWGEAPFSLDGLREYGTAVFEDVFRFLGSTSDSDLERTVPGLTGGTVPLVQAVNTLGLVHLCGHAGEIAALKGVHGAPGTALLDAPLGSTGDRGACLGLVKMDGLVQGAAIQPGGDDRSD